MQRSSRKRQPPARVVADQEGPTSSKKVSSGGRKTPRPVDCGGPPLARTSGGTQTDCTATAAGTQTEVDQLETEEHRSVLYRSWCHMPLTMTNEDTDRLRGLSRRLYDVMEEIGVTEDMRTLHRQACLALDIGKYFGYVLTCGSSFEGSLVPSCYCDCDEIHRDMEFEVILKTENVYKGSQLLVIEDTDTFPGYVKLQRVTDGQPQTINTTEGPQNAERLSSMGINYRGEVIDYIGRKCCKPLFVKNKHGPASSIMNKWGFHVLDITKAWFCKQIPAPASDWSKRPRRFNWPTDLQISSMRDMGCFFVGVGHEYSAESNLEWRISFTLQERLLMSSLNPCQHKVYVLLKVIRKEFLVPLFDDNVISSYHLKTCILHMAENALTAVWTENNLMNCVLQCLNIIYSWVHHQYCPNYFVKDLNLFKKIEFRRNRSTLLKVLKHLLGLKDDLFTRLRTNEIGTMLVDVGNTSVCKTVQNMRATRKLFLITCAMDTHGQCFIGNFLNQHVQRYSSVLDYYRRVIDMPDFYTYKDDVHKIIPQLIPWVHLYTGKQLLSDSLMKEQYDSRYALKNMAFEHFKSACPTDLVQVDFAKASYYFMNKQHRDCLNILDRIENYMTRKAIVGCSCKSFRFPEKKIAYEKRYARLFTNIDSLNRKEIFDQLAGCVVFLPSHEFITPQPIDLEMIRVREEGIPHHYYIENKKRGYAIISADVYLYFLKYHVNDVLKRRDQQYLSLQALQYAVITEESDHQDTAYNLLGWVYLHEHRIGDAIHYFMRSWNILPYNAAGLHMERLKGILLRICHRWLETRQ